MNYKIRKALPADMDEIILLCAEHAAFEQATYDATGKKEKLASFLFCDKPTTFCLIAENEKEIVGYATYSFEFSTWDAANYVHMDCLYLKPHARNFGIGEALIKEIVKAARENNCSIVQWQTPAFNERAIKFYKRIGAVGKEKLRFYLDCNNT